MTDRMRDVRDIIKFLPMVPLVPKTLAEFHEWNVGYAVDRFKHKKSNDELVAYFIFARPGAMSVMQTRYQDDREKYAVFNMVREACIMKEAGVNMVSFICEAWIAAMHKDDMDEMVRQGVEVRDTPGREDCLMVSSYDRKGDALTTRWVVRLKQDPSKNIMLARDDVHYNKAESFGYATYFFEPVRERPD